MTLKTRVTVRISTRLIVALLAAVATIAVRAEFQNDQVGFTPHHVFESANEGEDIDALTGNLTLTIPLGPTYKLNDTLSYGVTLHYNAKQWEYDCDPWRDHSVICQGALSSYQTYGLGFTLLPAHVYHKGRDNSWIYHLQLEDGSDHLFCDNEDPDSHAGPDPVSGVDYGCRGYNSFDAADLSVKRYHANGATSGPFDDGWIVETHDGRTIILGNVPIPSTKEAAVTEVRTTATRGDGTPLEKVEYQYSPNLLKIVDSQGRETSVRFVGAVGSGNRTVYVDVPMFNGSSDWQQTSIATYTLHFENHSIQNPSAGGTAQPRDVLTEIDLPGLGSSESYRFAYQRGTGVRQLWEHARTPATAREANVTNPSTRFRAVVLMFGAVLILGLGIGSQRQCAHVVAPMTLNVALPIMLAQEAPQSWRNLESRPSPPAVQALGSAMAYGYIPVTYLIWSIPLFRGDYRPRRRSVITFPLVFAISLIWVVGAGLAVPQLVGGRTVLIFVGLDLLACGAVVFLLWHIRKVESFASAALLNFVFFGWFAWSAFPWLGEMP